MFNDLVRATLLTIAVLLTACPGTTGMLAVNINGLPAGAIANVTISGPSSSSETEGVSVTITEDPGTYAVTAADVVVGGATYHAIVTGSPATVIADQTTTVEVVYAVPSTTTGTLQINVSGLPSGALAAITGTSSVSSFTESATSTLTLAPDTYTVTAADVVVGGTTYMAAVMGSPAVVTAGGAATVTVVYDVSPPTTGNLQINVSGLPTGASAAVSGSGPSSFTATSTSTLTVQPGDYTVTAANVISGPNNYTATITGSPAAVVAGETTTVTVVYAPSLGTLELDISGLPAGAFADVTLSLGGVEVATVTSTSTMTLTPGTYTITAANVISGPNDYTATITGSPAAVVAGETTTVTVVYAPSLGTLQLDISGLPAGAFADVTLSLGGVEVATVTSSSTMTLTPGTYTITAANVISGPNDYTATITGSPAAIVAGATTTVAVVYAPSLGTLQLDINGLPAGVLADVTLSRGGVDVATVTSTSTMTLTPGTYTVTAANVTSGGTTYSATITGSPAAIVAGELTTVTVTYAVPSPSLGTLQLDISGLPAGALADVTLSLGGVAIATVTSTSTMTLTPGTYTITAANVISGPNDYTATITGSPAAVVVGATTTVTVVYAPSLGTLQLDISGLPAGAFADVTLSLGGVDVATVTSTSTMTLTPGTYTVTAANVTSGGTTYTATITGSPAAIVAGATATVTVAYAALGSGPTIISVSQNYMVANQYTIAIVGTGFTTDGHTVANIDGVPCTGVTVTPLTGEQQLRCTVPTPHAPGFVSVTVTTSAGTTAVSPAFQYEYWSIDFYSLGQTAGDAATQSGMVIGADGNIWFTDRSFSKIGRVDSSGTITECALAGNPVTGATAQPVDIASGTDGNLWVTDYTFDVIYKISPTGFTTGACSVTTYSVPLPVFHPPVTVGGHPWAITNGPDGNIWFTLQSTVNGTFDQIGTINVTTDAMTEFALTTQGTSIWGITSGPDGQMWFGYEPTFTAAIGTISTSGTISSHPVINGVFWLTTGPDGNVWYLSPGGFLGMTTPAGVTTDEQPVAPVGTNRITADSRGAVWYSTSSSLGRFDTSLLQQRLYPVAAGGGVVVDANGDVWSTCTKPPVTGQTAGTNSICRLHI